MVVEGDREASLLFVVEEVARNSLRKEPFISQPGTQSELVLVITRLLFKATYCVQSDNSQNPGHEKSKILHSDCSVPPKTKNTHDSYVKKRASLS